MTSSQPPAVSQLILAQGVLAPTAAVAVPSPRGPMSPPALWMPHSPMPGDALTNMANNNTNSSPPLSARSRRRRHHQRPALHSSQQMAMPSSVGAAHTPPLFDGSTRRSGNSGNNESVSSDSETADSMSDSPSASSAAVPIAAVSKSGVFSGDSGANDDSESGSESSSRSGSSGSMRRQRTKVRRRKETSALVADALGVARSPRVGTAAAFVNNAPPAASGSISVPPVPVAAAAAAVAAAGSATAAPFSARKVFGGMFTRPNSSAAASAASRASSDRDGSPVSMQSGARAASASAGASQAPASAPPAATLLPAASLLFVSAKANDADQVRRLIDALPKPVDVLALRNPAQMAQTPLHVTASVACAKLLVARLPALLDVADDYGALPLHTAVRHNRLEVALYYLSLPGADERCHHALHLLTRVPWTGRSDCNATRVYETLLALGAQLGERDRRGRTPLHRAATHGNLHAVAAMLSLGDRSLRYVRDDEKNTPLVCAARAGHVDVLRLLLRDGDKSKLDMSRAAAAALQWQRTAALELLKVDAVAPASASAGAGAPAEGGAAPRDSLWACSVAGLDDAAAAAGATGSGEDEADTGKVPSAAITALPTLLDLLHIGPAKKSRRVKTKQRMSSVVSPADAALVVAAAAAPAPSTAAVAPPAATPPASAFEAHTGVFQALFDSALFRDKPLKVEACVAVLCEALAIPKDAVAPLRAAAAASHATTPPNNN